MQINSPSKRVKPVGSSAAEGIALGMTEYGFSKDASAVAQNLQTALAAVLTASTLRVNGHQRDERAEGGHPGGQSWRGRRDARRRPRRSRRRQARTQNRVAVTGIS